MRDEVYRSEIGDGREGDRLVVVAVRDAPVGCVSVNVRRGDLATSFTMGIEHARLLSVKLADAAQAAAGPSK